ncbi:sulfite exporter TauE/SafE family protein [Pantanalinema sp. GBBB05]|uniref:sulfite exporter TauE/SafE family protein n=1 Tax=Pantanalinema sp. GBBB05 TaxID=2604139 RepID=UPI001D42FC64|nr:sulfite exporter TauE/SafE family protein [Pantanalinema sp. GBBB05]
MTIFLLALASFVAWFISSLAGGGSPYIIMPMVNLLLDAQAIPPIVTIGMLLGNLQRTCVYWEEVDWQLTGWYLPGAIVGAVLGSFVFTQTKLQWLQVLLGVFLVASAAGFWFRPKKAFLQVKGWFFLPAGFVYAFLSGLLGSIGPILNPFYLNYGLVKENMIGTKSAHVLVVHTAKLITYMLLGAMTTSYLGYGLVIGLAAIPANWLGQLALKRMSEQQFRQFVLALVTISGVFILWDQRDFFVQW